MKTWLEENRKRITDGLFYLALTIELLLMILEKSEISFSYESYVFRVTFLITLACVLVMKHNKKEWIAIVLVLGFTFLTYYLTGKNDLLRVALFMMAARDIDLKKAMKYSFFVCCSGFLLIAVLSCAGILGDVSLVADFGRGADEKRYVFGFGHPNTLFSSVYAVFAMWLWVYGRNAGVLPYIVVSAGTLFISVISRTRTGLAVVALSILVAVIFRCFPKLSKSKAVYIAQTAFSPVFCVISAVLAAYGSDYQYSGPMWPDETLYWWLEHRWNFRMSNLYYACDDRGGVLSKWRLFAAKTADSYFDMGWVRLFYWYGILPTALIVIAILAVIYMCWKERDLWTLLIIFTVSLYTIVEATFVTRYLGRDFFLLIAGVYLGYYFREKGKTDV
jgi:hypothetical protein